MSFSNYLRNLFKAKKKEKPYTAYTTVGKCDGVILGDHDVMVKRKESLSGDIAKCKAKLKEMEEELKVLHFFLTKEVT